MKRNMTQWAGSLIAGSRRFGLPIATSPGIPLIQAESTDVFRSGPLQARAITALSQKIPIAAALTMMDLSVEAEAFGSPIRYSEDENPTVSAPIAADRAAIEKLAVPAVGTARTGACITAAQLCANDITDRPTLGGLIGPLSLAGRIADMGQFMLLLAMEPETAHLLLEKVTGFLIEYAKAFKAAGANGLIMAEPAAGLISPKMCDTFSSNYVRRVVDAVQDESFLFVLHNCGKTERLVPSMLSTGAGALHIGNAVDPCTILEQTPTNVPVIGNLDPVAVFRMGTPESAYAATRELLRKTASFPHFVPSSGCDIPPHSPLDNLHAFFKAIDDYNSEQGSVS